MKWVCIIFFWLILFSCNSPSLGYQNKISFLSSENLEVYLDGNKTHQTKVPLYDINGNEVDEVEITVFKQPEVDTSSWYKIGYQYL